VNAITVAKTIEEVAKAMPNAESPEVNTTDVEKEIKDAYSKLKADLDVELIKL
jgi:hypothetical protein